MKKIFASVGLAAISASTLQAQYAPGLNAIETSKPWSVSASLRGFYDDNYLTLPGTFAVAKTASNPSGEAEKRGSWGAEVAPSIAFNHSTEDTLVAASYVYDLRYYLDHSAQDSSHQFNAKLDHQFSERYKLNIADSFVIAQEPTVLDPGVVSTPLRVPGNNVRNTGNLDFFAVMTKLLDFHLGYANTVTSFQQTEGDVVGLDVPGMPGVINPAAGPSRSAALDTMDQLVVADLRWKFMPETTGVTGYQYEHVDYTSPEDILFPTPTLPGGLSAQSGGPGNTGARSDIRNSDSHFFFVGADQSITSDLNATIRIGGEYVDYYNFHHDELSPYADASLTWQFMPQSYVQAGVKHIHNSTDVVGTGGTVPVLDEESTAAYLSLSHTISSFTVSVLGQAQWSTFDGGDSTYNNKEEDFYVAGINLAYHINPFLLAEAGYNYNRLLSDLPDRAYVRNQVYIGIRATY
jgi:hypothetical protein